MNLYLLGWQLSDQNKQDCLRALTDMAGVYPTLDPETLCSHGQESTAFAASMSVPEKVCAPREYFHRNGPEATLFDGTPTSVSQNIISHQARSLSQAWDRLPRDLDGQFMVARLHTEEPRLQVMTDPLGVQQTFVLRRADQWLISNSVHLLLRITGSGDLDPAGVSLLLTQGWAGGDRTLRKHVRVIPAAQVWTWSQAAVEPARTTYYRLRDHLREPRARLNEIELEDVCGQLGQPLRSLSDHFGALECPITAGRDTRLLTALVLSRGAEADFFTGGDTASTDVQIGREIAGHLDVQHQVFNRHEELLSNWEPLTQRFVAQTDGMTSLSAARNAQRSADFSRPRPVHLYGGGGEIARGFFASTEVFSQPWTPGTLGGYLFGELKRGREALLTETTLELASRHIHDFVQSSLDDGFELMDSLDLFYAYERVGRWGGAARRPFLPHADVYSPFCTRPFTEAAFSMSNWDRYRELLHFDLIAALDPSLHAIAYEKAWRSDSLSSNTAKSRLSRLKKRLAIRTRLARLGLIRLSRERMTSKFMERNQRLELMLGYYRQKCLDSPNAEIWNYVNRDVFTDFTASDDRVTERRKHQQALWDIMTLFTYLEQDIAPIGAQIGP